MKPSREARFDGSFEGFREEARALLMRDVPPEAIVWVPEDDPQDTIPGLLAPVSHPPPLPAGAPGTPQIPRALLTLAERAACHRDPERFTLLYRVLWRVMHEDRALLARDDDDDVAALRSLERSVMREVGHLERNLPFHVERRTHGEHLVAHARPHHRVLRLMAETFAERFRGQTWSVLTPSESMHGDGQGVHFGPGVPDDLLELARDDDDGHHSHDSHDDDSHDDRSLADHDGHDDRSLADHDGHDDDSLADGDGHDDDDEHAP